MRVRNARKTNRQPRKNNQRNGTKAPERTEGFQWSNVRILKWIVSVSKYKSAKWKLCRTMGN